MAIYSGKNTDVLDLIAKCGLSEKDIKDIADKYLAPIPGEIRFMTDFIDLTANGSLSIDNGIYRLTNNKVFDGWVYPDGSYFYCSQFPEISAEYVKNNNDKFFQIPNLTSFYKSSVVFQPDMTYKTKKQTQNQLISHQHQISENGSINTQITIRNGFKVVATKNCDSQCKYKSTGKENGSKVSPNSNGDLYGFHNGKSTSTTYQRHEIFGKLQLNELNVLFNNIKTDARGKTDAVFQPEAINIPVMIYLGKPNYNYDNSNIDLIKIRIISAEYYDYDESKNLILNSELTQYNVINEFYIKRNEKINVSNLIEPSIDNDKYYFYGYDSNIENELTADTDISVIYHQKSFTVDFKCCSTNNIADFDIIVSSYNIPYGEIISNLPNISDCNEISGYNCVEWTPNDYNEPIFQNKTYRCSYEPINVSVQLYIQDQNEELINDNLFGNINTSGINEDNTAVFRTTITFSIDKINAFYRFKGWKNNNNDDIVSTSLTYSYYVNTTSTIEIYAIFEKLEISDIDVKFYLPYSIKEQYISDYTSTITTASNKITLTYVTWNKIITDKYNNIDLNGPGYFKFEWSIKNENNEIVEEKTTFCYSKNKNAICTFDNTYSKNTEYSVSITYYYLSEIENAAPVTVYQKDYGIKYDLNDDGCTAIKSSSTYTLKDNKDLYNDPELITNSTATYRKCYARITYKSGSQEEQTNTLGIIKTNSNNKYFYNKNGYELKAFSFEKMIDNFIPCGNYNLYFDDSCSVYNPDDNLIIGLSTDSVISSDNTYLIYSMNPVWIPLDSEYDINDKIGLYIRADWE